MKIRIDARGWDELIAANRGVGAAMGKAIRQNVREVSLDTVRDVKIQMPVDTGRARASWGSPEAEGIWEIEDGGFTIVQGTNVEYVEYLNEGHSKQAPAGFIDAIAMQANLQLVDALEADLEVLLS